MDVRYQLHKIAFEWDSEKANTNLSKHGVPFETACEAFFDPFVRVIGDEWTNGELRETVIGMTVGWRLLTVVYVMRDEAIRLIR
jgi:uncharacterized DUF497 family protein